MNKKVRIGSGNKSYDEITLCVQGLISLVLGMFSLYNPKSILLFLIFLLGSVIQLMMKMRLSYISFLNDEFIVERLFRREKRLSAELYTNVRRVTVSIPFLNALSIDFENGEKFRILGGTSKIDSIKAHIDELVTSARLNTQESGISIKHNHRR